MRRRGGVLAVAAALLAGIGCSLNPQPLPPDQPDDAGSLGTVTGRADAAKGRDSDGGQFTGTGTGAGAGSGVDATTTPVADEDAGGENSDLDGGTADGGGAGVDAALDARAEGSAADGAAHDATEHDAELDGGAVVDAPGRADGPG